MALTDYLVAATPLERAQMVWLYGADAAKIVVIPCGVDLNLFGPVPQDEARQILGLPAKRRVVLFVGRIEPLKGIDTLLRAMALVAHNLPGDQEDLSVIIIGGAPGAGAGQVKQELERLESLRVELGIDHLVTFLGAQNQDTLVYYYSAADMVVVPSHYESFGMVALEAMACGTPVVASQVGGQAFLVQDGVTGFTVPVDEPEALAEKLTVLVVDYQLRHKLGQQALAVAQQYAWENIAARILSLYGQVLTSP